ncbi:MAG: alpha/beta hydrolase [Paludibacter sp.]|nr:alpha/beta hydrolase [Paludibacter sp.]
MKKIYFLLISLLVLTGVINAQQEVKLYPNGPKESNGITEKEVMQRGDFVVNITEPRMYYYAAPKENASGTAVLICPGGGYMGVSVIKEGEEIAKWFNELGVTAFVLYYRMPNGHRTVPLTDAQTALKIIQKRANEWNINKDKIGIMGFSAGGHLASTVGTHFKTKSERPAFMILGYPVVTMKKELTHGGSRKNLIGETPTPAIENLYSNELQVTKNTPPTFIVHNRDDKVVPIENSIQIYKALQDKKVVAELDTFAVGGHGFGMRKHGIPVDNWPDLLKAWLKNNKLIN